jgi:hypothetical protein
LSACSPDPIEKKRKTQGYTFHWCTIRQHILIWSTLVLIFIRWSLKNGNVPVLQSPSVLLWAPEYGPMTFIGFIGH